MAKLLVWTSKKIKASTLIETLVASVIIIVVFTIASLTLNNVFKSTIKSNTRTINTHINKLEYLYRHEKLSNNYREDFKGWDITISKKAESNITFVFIEAIETTTTKTITKKWMYEGVE